MSKGAWHRIPGEVLNGEDRDAAGIVGFYYCR